MLFTFHRPRALQENEFFNELLQFVDPFQYPFSFFQFGPTQCLRMTEGRSKGEYRRLYTSELSACFCYGYILIQEEIGHKIIHAQYVIIMDDEGIEENNNLFA